MVLPKHVICKRPNVFRVVNEVYVNSFFKHAEFPQRCFTRDLTERVLTYDAVRLISYQLLLVYCRTVHSDSNITLAANVT